MNNKQLRSTHYHFISESKVSELVPSLNLSMNTLSREYWDDNFCSKGQCTGRMCM